MATQGFESVTVSSTSVGLTAATFGPAVKATITVEGGPVRFRLDGTAPTAAIGHELYVNDVLVLTSADEIARSRFIRRDGVDATIRATYEVI